MNTIELMLEALRLLLPTLEGDEYQTVKEAIAAGEAELQRRQDAINAVEFWISCDTDKRDAYCALLTLLKEEIK